MVFDALTAQHLSFNGYARETTPFLAKFVESATNYHNHLAASPYTTPATGSMLTGVHAWDHRAFQLSQEPDDFYKDHNLFSLFHTEGYHTIAYTHNPHAESLLSSMLGSVDVHLEPEALYLSETPIFLRVTKKDFNPASQSVFRAFQQEHLRNSLFCGQLLRSRRGIVSSDIRRWEREFPSGLPSLGIHDSKFVLEETVDWILQELELTPNPYLAYVHVWPPHHPYHTRKEFIDYFKNDGVGLAKKPEHLFSQGWEHTLLIDESRKYDEFLLYIDAEFKRLITTLESRDMLENTWVIFTSDHGDLFERGIWGHRGIPLYHGVNNVPLVIKAPRQLDQQEIYENTSGIDLLPTLLTIIGVDKPDWAQGDTLPPFGKEGYSSERPIVSFNPIRSSRDRKLDQGIFSISKGDYKLMLYFGLSEFEKQDMYEFYNLNDDPNELNDLSSSNHGAFDILKSDLQKTLTEIQSI
jgi:arylsulfatase A-like enzyme